MDIAALSTSIRQAGLSQAVGLRVLSMAKEQAVQQSADFVKMMELSVNPNLGGKLDIRA